MFLDLVVTALLWATFATVVSQAISIGLMWALGLPPRRLVKEIEDVQNPAVGATFFIVSLGTALWTSLLASDGVPNPAPPLETMVWIGGGFVIATLYTMILFVIAHRLMGREPGESVYDYLRREIVQEQNAAVAFFMGGLAIAPYLAILYQIF